MKHVQHKVLLAQARVNPHYGSSAEFLFLGMLGLGLYLA
jgi:hypothetical protein